MAKYKSDDQRKAMFANMVNPSSKRKSKRLRRPKATKSVSSSARRLPRRLPIVTIQGVKYFQDDRLKEFRAVDNPHKRIPYDSWLGSIWSGSVFKGSKSTPSVLLKQIKAKQREAVEQKAKIKLKKRSVTQKEWDSAPKGYKGYVNGEKYMLFLDDVKGTVYAPVKIINSPDLLEKESKRIDAMIKRKQSKEPLEGVRKHKLMTAELRKKITKLYSKEGVKDPVVHTRFFSPYSSYNLLVTEFDGKDILYGYVSGVSEGGDEWGYSSLNEIAKAEKRDFPGLNWVERDKYFKPKKFSETDIGKALRKTESPPVSVKKRGGLITKSERATILHDSTIWKVQYKPREDYIRKNLTIDALKKWDSQTEVEKVIVIDKLESQGFFKKRGT